MFANDDFDRDNFATIEHSIDMGNEKPIKHRMRRTPANLVKEEEYLEKMLKAKVIQPSVSE